MRAPYMRALRVTLARLFGLSRAAPPKCATRQHVVVARHAKWRRYGSSRCYTVTTYIRHSCGKIRRHDCFSSRHEAASTVYVASAICAHTAMKGHTRKVTLSRCAHATTECAARARCRSARRRAAFTLRAAPATPPRYRRYAPPRVTV